MTQKPINLLTIDNKLTKSALCTNSTQSSPPNASRLMALEDRCPVPIPLLNSQVSTVNVTEGATIFYTCPSGLVFDDGSQEFHVQCEDRIWQYGSMENSSCSCKLNS